MEVLGIDIGGTGIKGAIVDTETGELISKRYRISTPRPAEPEAIAKAIKAMVDHFKWTGIAGSGFPTPLSKGKALGGGNLHRTWKGVQVDELFKEATGINFTIINDADAAAIAEIHFGAGKGKMGLVAVITLGTGIGSGLFYDGKLIPNTELGHTIHKNDSFENFAADSIRIKEELSYKKWGNRLNKYFKHISLLLSPDLFIIGGSASKKLYKYIDRIDINAEIIPAENKNEAGIIGAAVAAEEAFK